MTCSCCELRQRVAELERLVTSFAARLTGHEGPLPLPPLAPASIERIRRLVSEEFGIPMGNLLGQSRLRSTATARMVGMYLATLTGRHSLAEIGASFGGRDHTTVIYAREEIARRVVADAELRRQIDRVLKRLELEGAA